MTERWNAFPPRSRDLQPERSNRASDNAPPDSVLDDVGTYRVHNPWQNFVGGTPMPEWESTWKGQVLPISYNAKGELQFDSHAGLPGALWSAVTLPGDVAAGRIDPRSDEGISRAMELASLQGGTRFGQSISLKSLLGIGSRKISDGSGLWNLRPMPQRDIGLDYFQSIPADVWGRLSLSTDFDSRLPQSMSVDALMRTHRTCRYNPRQRARE